MNGLQVFIGSSAERKPLAAKIAVALDRAGLSSLPWWDERAFRPGDITLPRLIQITRLCEASVLVFGGDDRIWFRPDPSRPEDPIMAVRDNVLLEYGLFVGQVGLPNTVIVAQEGTKLPSNVSGVCVLFYKRSESHVAIAERVQKHFRAAVLTSRDRMDEKDSTMRIITNWSSSLHEFGNAAASQWTSARLYEGREGAGAWRDVEADPAYSRRTQTNISGMQIAQAIGDRDVCSIISLGPGLGTVDAELVGNLKSKKLREYIPVDVNVDLLAACAETVADKNPIVECKIGIQCDFDSDASFLGRVIKENCARPRLFLLAGGTFGNADRSVSSQLQMLHSIMDPGDLFVFDLFCCGPEYAPDRDPFIDVGSLPDAVQKFFLLGLSKMTGNVSLLSEDSISRIGAKSEESRAEIGYRYNISIYDKVTGFELIHIRRFDYASMVLMIESAGFDIVDSKKVSDGVLERHVYLARK